MRILPRQYPPHRRVAWKRAVFILFSVVAVAPAKKLSAALKLKIQIQGTAGKQDALGHVPCTGRYVADLHDSKCSSR